ncbi:Uncharacterised protein [Afipia felis]|uniref:Uncharacterized protein n=2 Tax=Afipia felis TaxID=1035 RepID=A0A380WD55_AFIFE|nr:hypothetical protein HMPREF9697_01832 [Afipia felis ATCC 53690]SUU78012.1 Uncharacterised protein [Afipia felis]SUU86077.1 Uncharacterised protein [Afipia felis]
MGWEKSRNWSRIDLGNGMEISTTDQRDRGCGWVFHVSFDGVYGGDTLYAGSGFETEDCAKRGAEDWLHRFCAIALARSSQVEKR